MNAAPSASATSFPRLAELRTEMAKHRLDVLLVPMADAFQSEYVPDSDRRLAWLTSFTGSAGYAVVTPFDAAFFTDSRYTLQAAEEIDAACFSVHDMAKTMPLAWIEPRLIARQRIGYDPWLHTADGVDRLRKLAAAREAELVPVSPHPIDAVWHDRPAAPASTVVVQDMAYAGKSSADKRREVAAAVERKGCGSAIMADPASVAWLLNIRGGDSGHTPLALSRVMIGIDANVTWFIDPARVSDAVRQHVGPQVTVKDPADFPLALDVLARHDRPVLIDRGQIASWITDYLHGLKASMLNGEDPCALPRACKNAIELDGMRAAHRRDGAALVRFLAWLDGAWREGGLTEMAVETKLESFRRATGNLYRGTSFDTIAGAGAHGAIVHYRATPRTDAPLVQGQLFLCDSGGQYLDGTTDVTRTVALGDPTREMRDRFTRVLKGHIGLAAIRFPEGTTGSEIDVLARQHLWELGLDYGHGTGHGVGCYLGVHEGPQGISRRSLVPLQPGMVLSNEPGFYKAGQYGIRIENLQIVVETMGAAGAGDRRFFAFEPLTLAAIDRTLIDVDMLTQPELKWLNAYHARVRQVLRPMLDGADIAWLETATAPLAP